jgi:HEAT repeat protein
MRVALGLFIGFLFLPSLKAAPLEPAEELVYRGQPVGYWIGRLKAKDWPTRLDGAHGLREAGRKAWPGVPALIAALDDEDNDVRAMVVQALGSIGFGAEKALPRLGVRYERAEGKERVGVLTAMLRIDVRSPETLKRLRQAFRDTNSELREYALSSAIQVPDLGDREILAAARAALADEVKTVRDTAGRLMIHLGQAAHPALLKVLRGENKVARNEAIRIFISQRVMDAEVVDIFVHVLTSALPDLEPSDRIAACTLLGQLGPSAEAAVPLLEVTLKHQSAAVRLSAARALIKITPDKIPQAVATAVDVLKNGSARVEGYADVAQTLALAGPAGKSALPLLIEYAAKGDPDCITALGDIRVADTAVLSTLFELLSTSVGGIYRQHEAATALSKIGVQGKAHAADMRRYLTDELSDTARALVAKALVDIGCTDDDVAEMVGLLRPLAVADVVRLGRLARTCPAARRQLVACLQDAQNQNLARRFNRRIQIESFIDEPIIPAAIGQLLELGPALPVEVDELLNDRNTYAQVAAYYLVTKCRPKALALADRALLEGTAQPSEDGKTLSQWLKQAGHENPAKRVEAVQHLNKLRYPRLTVPALVNAMDDGDPRVQNAAMAVLSGYPAAMDFLLAAAATDTNLRDRLIGDHSLFERCADHCGDLCPYLQADPDPFMRLLAARVTYRTGQLDARALLEAMKKERAIRPEAAVMIASPRNQKHSDSAILGGELFEDGIFPAMMRDPDPEQCCAAIRVLATNALYSDNVLKAFGRTATAHNAEVRRVTAESASLEQQTKIEDTPRVRPAATLLMGLLKDPEAEVRLAAARSLGRLGPSAAMATTELRERLDDSDLAVRVAAAQALWSLDPARETQSAVSVLQRILKSGQVSQQRAALQVLGNMGADAEAALPDVVKLARQDRGQTLGHDAVSALGRIQPTTPQRMALLKEFLKDSGRRDLTAVARLVENSGTVEECKALVPLLERLVFHADKEVSDTAVQALGRLWQTASSTTPSLLSRLRMDDFRNHGCVGALECIVQNGDSARDVAAFLIQQSGDPKSRALMVCANLIPELGPHAEDLLPYMLCCTNDGCLRESTFADAFRRMMHGRLTEKSVPLLTEMLLRNSPDAYLAAEALEQIGPQAADSVPALKRLLLSLNEENRDEAACLCSALLAIEDGPSAETRKVLLRLPAAHLAWIALRDPSSRSARNLARFGPESNQLLQTLVEGLRAPDEPLVSPVRPSAQQVFQFLAIMAEQSGPMLPELLEVQRNHPKIYLYLSSISELYLQGRFDSALDWSDEDWDGSPLKRHLRHDCPEVRALRKFVTKQGKNAVPVIARYLKDDDPAVRLFAAFCAALLGPKAAELSKDLAGALEDRNGFPEERAFADTFEVFYVVEMLYAIAEVGPDKGITKGVGRLLKHDNVRVKAVAAWLLSQPGLDREQALTALSQVGDKADAMVRLHAVLARWRLKGNEEKAAQELDSFLSDKRSEVRHQAAGALCELGRTARPSMETFRKWAKSESWSDRLFAAEAYWAIAGETQTAVSLLIFIADQFASNQLPHLAELARRIGPEAEPLRQAMQPPGGARFQPESPDFGIIY